MGIMEFLEKYWKIISTIVGVLIVGVTFLKEEFSLLSAKIDNIQIQVAEQGQQVQDYIEYGACSKRNN